MAGVKKPHEDADYGDDLEVRASKAKRHDLEPPPMDDVDIKLAEKLDSILKVSETRKPKFFMNKTKANGGVKIDQPTSAHSDNSDNSKLRPRNLSKEELKERLLRKYETLVPELDPQRPKVNVVKILSSGESLELAKNQAKRQMERQLELNSVSKNQDAFAKGLSSFRFNDGYEMPTERRHLTPTRSTSRTSTNLGVASNKKPISKISDQSNQSKPMIDEGEKLSTRGSKSVKFAMDVHDADNESNRSKNNNTNEEENDDDDDDEEISTDDMTDSDYTTTGDEDEGNGGGRVVEID